MFDGGVGLHGDRNVTLNFGILEFHIENKTLSEKGQTLALKYFYRKS